MTLQNLHVVVLHKQPLSGNLVDPVCKVQSEMEQDSGSMQSTESSCVHCLCTTQGTTKALVMSAEQIYLTLELNCCPLFFNIFLKLFSYYYSVCFLCIFGIIAVHWQYVHVEHMFSIKSNIQQRTRIKLRDVHTRC